MGAIRPGNSVVNATFSVLRTMYPTLGVFSVGGGP
jgi:hypothetical protein